MLRGVDRLPHRVDVAGDSGRGLVVDHGHGLDGVRLVGRAGSAASVPAGAPSPHSTSTTCTSSPSRCIMSIQRWLNWP